MSTRADLEDALAKAEADLANGVAVLAKANADVAKAEVNLPTAKADLPKARARCLKALAALAKLNRAEGKPIAYRTKLKGAAHEAAPDKANEDRRLARPALANLSGAEAIAESDGWDGWTDWLIAGAANGPKLGTTASPSDRNASPHLAQSSEQLARAVEKPAIRQPRPRKETRRFISHFLAQEAGTRDTLTARLLAWQTIQLLSLVLAYLQYYFIDANLQIARLPSVAVLLWG